MGIYGKTETWKIVYVPKEMCNGRRGVALVEGYDRQSALYAFSKEYAGEYYTIDSCKKL